VRGGAVVGRRCARARILFFSVLLAAGCASALAEDGADGTPSLRAVIVGVAPFGMVDAQGRAAGIHAEVIARAMQRCGLRIDSTVAPHPRAMAMLASGEADLMFGLRSSAIDRLAHAFSPIYDSEAIVVGLAGLRLRGLADLHGKTVGHIRGTLYDMAVINDDAIAKYGTTTTEQALAMLREGRFDAVMGSRLTIGYSLEAMHIPRSALGTPLVLGRVQSWAHYAYRHYDPAVATRLADCFAGLRARGDIAQIVRRYAPAALKD
jgi:ABC-type amino acid transport substrate-binding protein